MTMCTPLGYRRCSVCNMLLKADGSTCPRLDEHIADHIRSQTNEEKP